MRAGLKVSGCQKDLLPFAALRAAAAEYGTAAGLTRRPRGRKSQSAVIRDSLTVTQKLAAAGSTHRTAGPHTSCCIQLQLPAQELSCT